MKRKVCSRISHLCLSQNMKFWNGISPDKEKKKERDILTEMVNFRILCSAKGSVYLIKLCVITRLLLSQ